MFVDKGGSRWRTKGHVYADFSHRGCQEGYGEWRSDFVEIVGDRNARSSIVITCEHASNEIPKPWTWDRRDRWLTETHWAYDLGASTIAREIARDLSVVGALACFSRLLVDANRSIGDESMFLSSAEGRRIYLNGNLTVTEMERRIDVVYQAYHEVVHELAARPGEMLISVHSFTPVYEGKRRKVEVGVVHFGNLDLARLWRKGFEAAGFESRVDEPYAGRDGFMFSARFHGETTGRIPMLLEFRQDLLEDGKQRERLVDATVECIRGSR